MNIDICRWMVSAKTQRLDVEVSYTTVITDCYRRIEIIDTEFGEKFMPEHPWTLSISRLILEASFCPFCGKNLNVSDVLNKTINLRTRNL